MARLYKDTETGKIILDNKHISIKRIKKSFSNHRSSLGLSGNKIAQEFNLVTNPKVASLCQSNEKQK